MPPHSQMQAGMGGFFDDVGKFFEDAVSGLAEALEGALQGVINTIKQIGETVALVVRAAIGDVEWSEVLDSVGVIFQQVATVAVYLNPIRMSYELLSTSPLTAHAFNELDKFTGGMITTATNVSDLPLRAMRGDPISKVELIRDALFIIQVAAIVFTGPVGLGLMLGVMVGKQVCSKQTHAQEACTAAFAIAGAAAGSWGSAASGVNWGTSFWESGNVVASDGSGFVAGESAYNAALANQAALASTDYAAHFTIAASEYLTERGIHVITQEAVALCQRQGWAGDRECQIVGGIAEDFVNADPDKNWDEFLAEEVARIGAEELMLQWFPPESPEHQAIAKKKWEIKYVDQAVDQTVIKKTTLDPKALLLGAAGIAMFLVGVGS